MESDKEIITRLTGEIVTLKKEIDRLNCMRRVKSIKYENKIIKFIQKENKATLAEIAELLGIKGGNASRVLIRMMADGRILRPRRGVYKLKKVK